MRDKMDEVDTFQQRQIDGLLVGLGISSILIVIWLACLTLAITMK